VNDLWVAAGWFLVLGLGISGCIALRALGMPRHSIRDLLHVGAGTWPLGWTLWHTAAAPVAFAAFGLAATLLVPLAARRSPAAARLRESVSGGGETWAGLSLYALSVTAFTWAGVDGDRFPAAAALLALALGDGLGGAAGRRFGRFRFAVPFAKPKTFEGSLAVAGFAALGIALAAAWFRSAPSWPWMLGAAFAAAVAEALAPRSTDNLLVPAAVWLVLRAA